MGTPRDDDGGSVREAGSPEGRPEGTGDRDHEGDRDRSGETPDGIGGTNRQQADREPENGDPNENGNGDGGGWKPFVRDVTITIVSVSLLAVYLFAISGVWPPMVAIESGSMEPNVQVNDLAFVMDADRFQPSEGIRADGGNTGVVTAAVGAETGYSQFGRNGDVIVFAPNGSTDRTPVIHRAMFWVEAGENWCRHEAANPSYLGGSNGRQCVADHSGFITKGDNNPAYDQANNRISAPVRPDWVVGTAEARIPLLGWFRLQT